MKSKVLINYYIHFRKLPSDSHSSKKRIHLSSDAPRERTSKQTKLVYDRVTAGDIAENIRSRNNSVESGSRNDSSEFGGRNSLSEYGGEEVETLLKTDNLYHIMCCEPHSFRISNLSLNETESKTQAQGIGVYHSKLFYKFHNMNSGTEFSLHI